MENNPNVVYDVAIIGLGPAGAGLANLLGQAGLSVLVLERDAAIYPLPRAIHFDGEVMRIFQGMGLRDAVEAISRPGLKGMEFVNADGKTLLVRGGTTAQGPHGCANNYYFHQPELEAVLRQGLARFGHVAVRLQTEVTQLAETSDGVEIAAVVPSNQPFSLANHAQTATENIASISTRFKARYVVGCDGARSIVRKTMGSTNRDLGLHQPWLVFDALLTDRGLQALPLPVHTVQLCDPARPMTFCNVTANRRRWEIMLMPGDDPAALLEPARLWQLVARWIPPAQATSDFAAIERATLYTFHSVITEGWRSRTATGEGGRLLLAGDACHQSPPFLGQGMCAGMRDVANLAWKLARVLQGHAPATLLDSYESERAPHVEAFVALAVRLGDIIQTTDPALAAERDAKFLAGNPQIFQFPAPGLGTGRSKSSSVLAAAAAGSAAASQVGQTFPQPRLDTGVLLDEAVGHNFLVLARPELLAAGQAPAADDACQLWQATGARVLAATDTALAGWLQAHGVQAVVVRPDRYIFGVANNQQELAALASQLAGHLTLSGGAPGQTAMAPAAHA